MYQHVGCFIDSGDHCRIFRSRRWDISITVKFCAHLLMRDSHGMSISFEQLNAGSIQSAKPGQNFGAGSGHS
jgi:hypothetical protein